MSCLGGSIPITSSPPSLPGRATSATSAPSAAHGPVRRLCRRSCTAFPTVPALCKHARLSPPCSDASATALLPSSSPCRPCQPPSRPRTPDRGPARVRHDERIASAPTASVTAMIKRTPAKAGKTARSNPLICIGVIRRKGTKKGSEMKYRKGNTRSRTKTGASGS